MFFCPIRCNRRSYWARGWVDSLLKDEGDHLLFQRKSLSSKSLPTVPKSKTLNHQSLKFKGEKNVLSKDSHDFTAVMCWGKWYTQYIQEIQMPEDSLAV